MTRHDHHQPSRSRRLLALIVGLALVAAACGGGGGDGDEGPVELVLLTHDSFAVSDDVLARFTDETGIDVRLLPGGDAGEVVNQAILTSGEPLGDVLFGVDTTFLSRALEADLFVPHRSSELDHVPDEYEVDERNRVTPIDRGDVCLNYDVPWFADAGLPVPETLEDLTDPRYEGLLVVENPATSSPGLAFLAGTVDRFGDEWPSFWADLRANDVEVTSGWEEAYYGSFSGGSGEGDRPLVVSYASSPPAEVVFADPPVDEPPTGVIADSCVRQVEFAGILRGTEHEEEAGQLIDFLLSRPFQEDVPLQMFVFPVRDDAELPDVFVEHAVVVDDPLEVPYQEVGRHREAWIEEWTEVVLR